MALRTPLVLLASALVLAAAGLGACSGSSSPGTGSGADASAGDASSGSGSGGSSSSGGGSGSGSGSSTGSGSSSGSSTGSGSSSGSSSGGPGDGGATCPTIPCSGGSTCCADLTNDVPTCAPTCLPADTIACLGAKDCSGTTPDCCATDILDGMDAGQSFPHCYTQSLTTKCGTCASSIQLDCKATQLLHVCQAASECADDTMNPNCCLVAGYHVCVNNELKVLGSLSCL